MTNELLRVTSKGFQYLEDLRDKEDRHHTQTGWMRLPSDTDEHWDKYVLAEIETRGLGRSYEREGGDTSISYIMDGASSSDPEKALAWSDQLRSALRRLFEAGYISFGPSITLDN